MYADVTVINIDIFIFAGFSNERIGGQMDAFFRVLIAVVSSHCYSRVCL